MIVRGKIRESKGIEGSGVIDFLLHWFCGCCAIAQEGREVQGGGQSMARE
jgi:Cys-rich protein (TIGR01571 family)